MAALGFTQATTEMSLLLTAMTYAFFQDMGSLAMTVYTPEVYPVRIRGKGTALAMGWGRFGGMASPMIAGVLMGPSLFGLLLSLALIVTTLIAAESALGFTFDPRYRDFPFASLTMAVVPFALLMLLNRPQAGVRDG